MEVAIHQMTTAAAGRVPGPVRLGLAGAAIEIIGTLRLIRVTGPGQRAEDTQMSLGCRHETTGTAEHPPDCRYPAKPCQPRRSTSLRLPAAKAPAAPTAPAPSVAAPTAAKAAVMRSSHQ